MPYKTEIEYLNIVLSEIQDITSFNVWKILSEDEDFEFELATEELKQEMLDMSSRVQRLGMTYKYFDKIDHFEYRLTEKGIKAKELGGHQEYEKFISKKPLDWYRIVPICLSIIFGVSAVYYANRNYNLKLKQTESKEKTSELEKKIIEFESKNDSLNKELRLTKIELEKLKNKTE
ncbi:hypothetical protein ACSIGC_09305 [Tenacibaculum sp. ZS6-P6]|uniref:hypothetical protein n=1 Tax=Tenacibaculum sp. ZS6-P6 TaxID=3447503 RepID=UPI003F9552EF